MTAINRMVAKVYDRNCGDYAFVQQATPILQEIAVLTDALANAEDAGDRDEYETHERRLHEFMASMVRPGSPRTTSRDDLNRNRESKFGPDNPSSKSHTESGFAVPVFSRGRLKSLMPDVPAAV